VPKLLLTSYKFYDAIVGRVSADLAEWLHDHEKKWKTQVRWDLPDDDASRAEELVSVLSSLAADPKTTGKRGKAIDRLISEIRDVYPEPAPAAAAEPELGEVIEEILSGKRDAGILSGDGVDPVALDPESQALLDASIENLQAAGIGVDSIEIQAEDGTTILKAEVPSTAGDQAASQEPVEAPQAPEEVAQDSKVEPAEKVAQKAPQAAPEPVAPAAPPPQKRAGYLLAELFNSLNGG